jgi:hypothetical protein
MEPTHVYHYTDAAGFLAITKSKTLWASCIECLNDEKEFRHCLDVAGEIACSIHRADVEHSQKRLDAFLDILRRLWGMAIYSCSFSAQRDLLSQWRGYCGNGNGYNIGFDLAALKGFCDRSGFVLKKCVYDRSEQDVHIRPIVQHLFGGGFDDPGIGRIEERLVKASEQAAYAIRDKHAAFFKDNAFREEEEWRLVAYVHSHEDPRLKIRPSKTSLIPYIEIDLNSAKEVFFGVTIGPGPFKRDKLAFIVMQQLLISKLGPNINVTHSTAPYRYW